MSDNHFKSGLHWLDALMPQGIVLPSSNLISGPAGAGKPLIGALFCDAWLKQGGALIHLLIHFEREYAEKLLIHFNPGLTGYDERVVFIAFDPKLEGLEKTGNMYIKANLLKPDIFDEALDMARALLPDSQLGVLIYASALNMLLFSATYGQMIHQKVLDLLKSGQNMLFTISDNVLEEQTERWEEAADNVFYSHGIGIMRLAFRIEKMKNVDFKKDEVEVPLSEDELSSVRSEAEQARMNLIPMIRKI